MKEIQSRFGNAGVRRFPSGGLGRLAWLVEVTGRGGGGASMAGGGGHFEAMPYLQAFEEVLRVQLERVREAKARARLLAEV